MEEKFTLNRSCFLVKGLKRGAIYNLESGDIYSIDEKAKKFLDECKKDKSINEIVNQVNSLKTEEILNYCYKLEKEGLGLMVQKNKTVEKVRINKPPLLEFIWLELTTQCPLKCDHCYAQSDSEIRKKEIMDSESWVKVLKEAHKLGCKNVQFIGGEPMIIGEDLKKLILKARGIGYTFIEVFTNGIFLTENWAKFFSENEVKVAVSIYGPNSEIHDKITHYPGSFKRVTQALQYLKKYNVSVRTAMTIMNKNQNYLEDTQKFLYDNFDIVNFEYDIVRPSGRGCKTELIPSDLVEDHQTYQPNFSQCKKKDFERRKFGHPCFSREICVTANGEVFPCIMERDIVLGNVCKKTIKEVINKPSSISIRQLNKDKIKVCQDCEYRYACFDCRPKAKSNSKDNDLYAKPSECHYDPYEGKWDD